MRRLHSKKRPRDVPHKYKYEPAIGDLLDPHFCENPVENTREQYNYLVVSWGHAAGGKTGIDHEVDRQSGLGHPIHKSRWMGAVKVAAGVQHSLVLDKRGILHGFGESNELQLGIRRRGTFIKPKQVHPTGLLKNGVDYVLAEMAGGRSFSLARELNNQEQIQRTEMLAEATKAVREVLRTDSCNPALQWAWAHIRQELFMASRAAGGTVLSWGTGSKGQLGHGDEFSVEAPRPIRSLMNKQIRCVAAGYEHALAIGPQGELYTWGKGMYGRLGHGDSENRDIPSQVFALEHKYVRCIAAGAAHTVVVVTAVSDIDDGNGFAEAEVYCFGRGGHGRVGKADLRHSHLPHLLEVPQSLQKARIKAIACGAAHTVLLAVNITNKSLARPWGVQTTMYSWGYGTNGQLGTGETCHRHFPAKVRMPASEVVIEIAAGRTHSLCRTKLCNVFGWGKGWRGQLGLGGKRVSIVPRKLTLPGLCIMLSTKYQHSIAICEYGGRSKSFLEQHPAFQEVVSRLPQHVPSRVLSEIGCLRRSQEQAPYSCTTCQIKAICNACRLLCHRGHHCSLRRDKWHQQKHRDLGCQCGPSDRCRALPTVLDCFDEKNEQQHSLVTHGAAVVLQKYARRMVSRRLRKRLLQERATARSIAVRRFYHQRVLDIVFDKLTRRKQKVLQVVERQRMQNEEILWRLIIYYKRLQKALQALDLTKQAFTVLANSCCIRLPVDKEMMAERQTSFLSWLDVRVDQLGRPAKMRLPPKAQHMLTIEYPIYLSSRAKVTTDPDLQCIFEKYHTHTHLDRQIIDGEDISVRPRRRYSITDPNHGYQRMTRFEIQMRVSLFKQRRQSLPDLRPLHGRVSVQKFGHREALQGMLEVPQRRELVIVELLDPKHARTLLLLNEKNRRARYRRVLQFAWMNPRLEIQVRSRLLHPTRRATIAEPERIGIVRDLYMKRREIFASLRVEGVRKQLPTRRRSFDHGENRDAEQGILSNDTLSVDGYLDRNTPPTLAELIDMGRKMQQQLTRLAVANQKAAERDVASRGHGMSTGRDSVMSTSRGYRAYTTRSSHSGDESERSSVPDVLATRRTSHRTARQSARSMLHSARSSDDSVRDGPTEPHMITNRSTARLMTSRTNDIHGSHRTARTIMSSARSGMDSANVTARSSQGGKDTHRSQRSVIANTDLVVIEDRYGREWVEVADDAGNTYFFDPETNESRWEIALPLEQTYASNRADISSSR